MEAKERRRDRLARRGVWSTGFAWIVKAVYTSRPDAIGELLYVCVGPERLEVLDRGVHRLAELARIPDGAGQTQQSDRSKRGRHDVTLLQERLAAWDPAAADFATKLRARKRYPGAELNHIVTLQVTWSVDDIVKALVHAMAYGAFDARAVERILEARFKPRRLAEQIADATRDHLREVMKDHPVEQRALSSYQTLRTGDGCLTEETRDHDPIADQEEPR